jgi:iron complex outermembrane receptor protein
MPFMNFGSLDNWTFELAAMYTLSTGESHRAGIRGDRLDHALGWNSTTGTPCENDTFAELRDDVVNGCVPVDLFAPSLYPIEQNTVVGDFATQAERDYLFDDRDFDTEYEQTIFTAFATGDLFEVPAGPVAFGIGAEYRKDEITSLPDDVARDGLFFGFFSDGGAVGDVDITELFAEVEVPIFAGTPGFQEMNINLSSRLTDHEIYGENWTWSGKFGWRPTDSLLLRATYGTAFRAPNLRELYLQDQTGFLNIFDPCLIPEDALDPITGDYIPGGAVQLPGAGRRPDAGAEQRLQCLQRRSCRWRLADAGSREVDLLVGRLVLGSAVHERVRPLSGCDVLRDRYPQYDHRAQRPVHRERLL